MEGVLAGCFLMGRVAEKIGGFDQVGWPIGVTNVIDVASQRGSTYTTRHFGGC